MAKGKLPDLVKAKLGNDATIEFVQVHAKHRYFYFRGNKKIRKIHKNALNSIIKEYPKRNN
jgi:hypothetical protein